MHLIKAELNQIKNIVDMSVRAFGTDTEVGGKEGDYPPEYDSQEWHREMAVEGHLFQAVADGKSVLADISQRNEESTLHAARRNSNRGIIHVLVLQIRQEQAICQLQQSQPQLVRHTNQWNRGSQK